MKVEPLRKRTLTLEQLQRKTLKVLRLVRKHLNSQPWKDGTMTDDEFLEAIIEPLESEIVADRHVLGMHRKSDECS